MHPACINVTAAAIVACKLPRLLPQLQLQWVCHLASSRLRALHGAAALLFRPGEQPVFWALRCPAPPKEPHRTRGAPVLAERCERKVEVHEPQHERDRR